MVVEPSVSRLTDYHAFVAARLHSQGMSGFAPTVVPSWLFDFQAHIVDWATRKGCAAVLGDCGLGKTPIQLVWAQNVVERTNRPVLIVAPLAASAQTVREAEKFGIDCERSRDGKHSGGARVVVTNYERLEKFNATDFSGMVCDESSILKNFDGVTKQAITDFMRRLSYRLLCTATAAPNDYIELGTSSEALGEMGYVDMLGAFFKNDESNSISPLAYDTKWRLKGHAVTPFWRWVCSWSRAFRRPSDLGFDDGPFILPALTTSVTTVGASRPADGCLFVLPAANLHEQRAERRATLRARCECVAEKADHRNPFLAWAHLNDEADLLEDLITGARQVKGAQSDEEKEELFEAFRTGQLRALVTKPRIASFGVNWQHCAHMSVFPSHSYEQFYQGVRRCWRFGQTKPVTVEIVTTEGEADVLGNLTRKAEQADQMFARMVEFMREAQRRAVVPSVYDIPMVPAWVRG